MMTMTVACNYCATSYLSAHSETEQVERCTDTRRDDELLRSETWKRVNNRRHYRLNAGKLAHSQPTNRRKFP